MLRSGGKKWRGLAGLGRVEIPFQKKKKKKKKTKKKKKKKVLSLGVTGAL
jgi:hypothetical protein